MRFSVNLDVFSEAVSFPVAMLPSRIAQAILGGVLLEAADGKVTFSIFNFEVSAKTSINAEVTEPGRAVVPGKLLANIAKKLRGSEIELEVVDNKVQITSGQNTFQLPVMPVEEYPQLPSLEKITGEVRGSDFATAISQVFPAASSEDVTPVITSVRLHVVDNTLTLTATDRYRVAIRGIEWENHSDQNEIVALVPARVLHEVSKQLPHAETVQIVIQADGDRQMIGFIADGKAITSQLVSGNFPPVERLFPSNTEHSAVINTAELREAVDLVSVIVDQDTALRFNFTDGNVSLHAIGSEAAQGSSSVDAHLAGNDIDISLKPNFLKDGLNGAQSEFTKIAFTWNEAQNKPGPVLITGQRSRDEASEHDFKYLLQPNLLMR
ncbi:MAG: DNA polymerase III subunit beta [Microbacteriaceae bacterium]|nr:DNA polymerase III subunit beta [Microbacteriaceae bacterium]